MLAFVNQGSVRLQNRRLRERTPQYPELQILAKLLNTPAILDGEIVAFHEGKPSFPQVIKRDFASQPENISRLVSLVPVTYVVFDILYWGDKDLTVLPLVERQLLLAKSLTPAQSVIITDNFAGGKDLFAAVSQQGLEGIVAKEKNSRYVQGRKARSWLKIKLRHRRLWVVGGYTTRGNIVNSLLVGGYDQNRLHYLGKAGSGLSQQEWYILTSFLNSIGQDQAPFVNPPRARSGTFHWVTPTLTVMVEFAEWTEAMHLRAPVIVGFSSQKPEQCVIY